MDFLSTLLATAPSGFWATIVFAFENFVNDYGVALILITISIRFLLLPFDLLNKYIMKQNTRKQAKLKPQLDKLNKTYKNNPQMLNQKTMELYKRENYSVTGTCFGMLANMAVTMVVFFTLFATLNNISYYKQIDQFETLAQTYNESVIELSGDATFDITSTDQVIIDNNQIVLSNLSTEQLGQVEQTVVAEYGEIKQSFLWIKNLWKADTSTNSILTYSEFSNIDGTNDLTWATEDVYNAIIGPVDAEYGGANGYYILIVLAAVSTFMSLQLSTWISKYSAKRRGKVYENPVGSNKILTYIMPLVMALFALRFTAAFGIYIVAGSLFTMLASPLMTLIADHLDHKQMLKEESQTTISYSRKK